MAAKTDLGERKSLQAQLQQAREDALAAEKKANADKTQAVKDQAAFDKANATEEALQAKADIENKQKIDDEKLAAEKANAEKLAQARRTEAHNRVEGAKDGNKPAVTKGPDTGQAQHEKDKRGRKGRSDPA